MPSPQNLRIAVIGAGISGIAAAHMLKKNGFEVVVFEKADKPGGVWAVAYPGVHLQNLDVQYHRSDFPWPFKPDLHPSVRFKIQDAVASNFRPSAGMPSSAR